MSFESVVILLEMIGSIAFAISGVMVAREKHMDIFGAIILGCTTACGGGLIRDLILGNTPPSMFVDPMYVSCAFVVSLITFIVIYRPHHYLDRHQTQTNFVLNVTDSLGLAVFVVMGARTAVQMGYGDNHFLCIFVGTLTGIGGGILRDMMAGQMPLILRSRIYGVAAIAGCVVYMLCYPWAMEMVGIILGACTTLVIRYCAIRYRLHLPRL